MTRRVAILSDVHADVHALHDALATIARMGCDEIVCAGDVVDFGLFPDETIALLIERNIPVVRGNHDRWAVKEDAARLSKRSRTFLAALPPKVDLLVAGVRIAVHHASPRGDMEGIYPDDLTASAARSFLDAADADVLLVGHTHIPFAVRVGSSSLIANPGAVLRYAADDTHGPAATASFGILELPSLEFQVFRVHGPKVSIPPRRLADDAASNPKRPRPSRPATMGS